MAEKITKAELVDKIFENCDLSKKDISKVIDLFLQETLDSVGKGVTVELRGFGSFFVRKRAGTKNAVNPRTGESIGSIAPHFVPAFRAGKKLKSAVLSIPCPEK